MTESREIDLNECHEVRLESFVGLSPSEACLQEVGLTQMVSQYERDCKYQFMQSWDCIKNRVSTWDMKTEEIVWSPFRPLRTFKIGENA